MKKSTVTAAKTVAPAKKASAKAVKKIAAAPAKSAGAPVAKTPVAKTSVAKVPAAKAPAVKAPAVKAPAVKAPPVKATAKLPATQITALINVGFGNTLYVRGEGAGLSWDTGLALDCVGDGQWSVSISSEGEKVVYKFLINDLTWSAGADYVAEPGSKVTVEPAF